MVKSRAEGRGLHSATDNARRRITRGALDPCFPHDAGEVTAQPAAGTILVVEDEPNFRSVLSQMLRRQGYTVVTANNGALAWEHLRAQRYDVILCDILMPEISGPAFYILLQLGYPALCSRVIFLTGDILRDTTTAFLQQCGQPWLYKPCEAAAIRQAITQVLRTADAPSLV